MRPWTRIATVVPSSGRARSIPGKEDGMCGEQTLHAIGDVAAGERGSGNILDVSLQREWSAVTLAHELRAPQRLPDLTAIGFSIFEDLDPTHAAVCFEPERVGDVVVSADHLIDDEPSSRRN